MWGAAALSQKRNGRFAPVTKNFCPSASDPETVVRDQVLVAYKNRDAERERGRSNVARVPAAYLLE
jgi:hypothetical protein